MSGAGLAVVSGGAGGVGRAVARRLLAVGHDVALTGRDDRALARAATELAGGGGKVLSLAFDVADRSAAETAIERARREAGPVRVAVHAAGVAASAPLLPPDDALFDRTIATNLRGAWVLATTCLPGMVRDRRGAIVFVSSTAGLRGAKYVAAYVASKHGVVGLARAMAEDLRGRGVTVNAVCPGFLDTPMTDRTIDRVVAATGRTREQALADVLATAGQPRLLAPDEVADVVMELATDPTTTGEAVEL